MIFEEVGVFVEVDGFEGEFTKTFAAIGVGAGVGGYSSAAEFTAGAVLEMHISKPFESRVEWASSPGNQSRCEVWD